MRRAIVFSLLSWAPLGLADEIVLRSGGRIMGVVAERSADSVTVDVGPGRVTLALSRVDRIIQGSSDLALYRQQAQRLAPGDVQGWLELGGWAREHDLLTQAREAVGRALAADPACAAAHQALGHMLVAGRWLTPEQAYRAQGYVPFEGRWLTPQEHEALLRERAERTAAERARIEAEARVRETDARARAAEAETRRAEAERATAAASMAYGVPLWLAGGPACVRPPRPPVVAPPPAPAPPPRPPRQTDGNHTHVGPTGPIRRP